MKKYLKTAYVGMLWMGIVASVLMMTACSVQKESLEIENEQKGIEVKITVTNEWVGSSTFTDYFAERYKIFCEENREIEVQVMEVPNAGNSTLDDKLKILILGGELPDVFYTNDRNIIESAYRAGLLYNLEEFYEKDTAFQKELSEETMTSWNKDKEGIYGISSSSVFFGIYYNKQILKRAGYEEFPTTWEEFYEMCEILVEMGIPPMTLETKTSFIPSVFLLARTASLSEDGERIANTAPMTEFTAPEVIQAATELQMLYQKYSTHDVIGSTSDVMVDRFINGEIAMCMMGTWRLEAFRESLGTNLAMAKLPGEGVISYPDYAWFSGAKSEKEAEAAYKFIKNFNNAQDQQLRMEMVGMFPDSLNIDIDENTMDDIIEQLLEWRTQVEYSASSPWILFNSATMEILEREYSALARGENTPQEFAENMAQTAKRGALKE